MLHFECDYLEGAHPRILEKLSATNLDQTPGYGADKHCERAAELIRKACGAPEAQVWFLVGGTQTNATVIRSILRNYEGVLSADTGHITGHEAGAIEASGHKVLTLPEKDGKISAETVEAAMQKFLHDPSRHFAVHPGLVYISHPTEYGTLYTLDELKALRAVCDRHHLPLYIDGARLGYGLAAEKNDVTLDDIARLADVFYIGGTKVGALFGEALVITTPELLPHFYTTMKQSGAVLAKGRLLGIQFEALFEDDLYVEVGRHAVGLAKRLTDALLAKSYELPFVTGTNQVFAVVTDEQLARLREVTTFAYWAALPEHRHVVRFVTSWATKPEDVDALIAAL